MEIKKYVVTGGPGCGKTTILNLLQGRGYGIVPEAARVVLRENPAMVGLDLQKAIVSKQIELESRVNGGSVSAFLDRGILDNKAYADYFGCGFIDNYKDVVSKANYQTKVFYLKPLSREFYQNDSERRESYEEAVKIGEKIQNTYLEHGYNVIALDPSTPEDRLEKIIIEVEK